MHKELRCELIAKFANDCSDIPSCFGSLPEGNETAGNMGCHECDLFNGGASDICSNATEYVQKKEKEREKATRFGGGETCSACAGYGLMHGTTTTCPVCRGNGKTEVVICPKCKARSGNDWSQCKGDCPMPGTPHFKRFALTRDDRGPLFVDRNIMRPLTSKQVLDLLNRNP